MNAQDKGGDPIEMILNATYYSEMLKAIPVLDALERGENPPGGVNEALTLCERLLAFDAIDEMAIKIMSLLENVR